MVTIYAEKPDMGTKIAAALDCIHLDNGTRVKFNDIQKYEKPIKAQRTKDGYFRITYNGQETIVTWGFGHMVGLKQGKDYDPAYEDWNKIPLPFIPEKYELKQITDNSKQMAVIKKYFMSSDLLICATDNDREGDLIFNYIYSYFNCTTPFKRAIYNQQSQEEYLKAFSHLVDGKDRLPVIAAGRARSAGDFIVGAGPTVAMSLKYKSGSKPLSVGRVQTAVLNMIVEREKNIKNFKPQDYYVIKGKFATGGIEYEGDHEIKKFENKEDAQAVLNKITDKIGTVLSIEEKTYKKDKPLLYSQVTLQIEANKKYGFSLDHTLSLAQSLYEKGLTTYPRTDANHLPEDMMDEMEQVFTMLKNNQIYGSMVKYGLENEKCNWKTKHYFDNSKIESHYAIVTTKKDPSGLTGDEEKLYDLIAKSVISMLYNPATMSKTTLATEVSGEKFLTKGNSVVDMGFMRVLGSPKDKMLPPVKENDTVSAECMIVVKQTEPPNRYTAATLVNAMVNCGKTLEDEELKKVMSQGPGGKPKGLGRPSSQAGIVKTLEDRDYIKTEKKTIFPTERGMAFIDALPVEELKSAVMTAEWEKRLDDIEKGTESYRVFMNDLENSVRRWTVQIESSNADNGLTNILAQDSDRISPYNCPCCGRPMLMFDWGYSCSGRKEGACRFSFGKKIWNKTLSVTQIKKLLNKGETDMIEGFVYEDKEKNIKRVFNAVLTIDRENQRVINKKPQTDETDIICPFCGKKMLKNYKALFCPGYKDKSCMFYIYNPFNGKTLSEDNIKQLVTDGRTEEMDGFRTKNGDSTYRASLYLDREEKKISMIFPEKEKSQYTCYICGKPMEITGYGYACSGRNDKTCNLMISNPYWGFTIPEKQIELLMTEGKTQVMDGFTAKNGSTYKAYLMIDKDSQKMTRCYPQRDISSMIHTNEICPKCGKGLYKDDDGYVCSSESCNFTLGTVKGVKLNEFQMKDLLKGRKVHVDGMTGKKGKFSANIYLAKAGKYTGLIQYEFNK